MAHDTLALIARFQPFHNGHKAWIEHALERYAKVCLLIGSANVSRSARDPFTAAERADMIRAALSSHISNGRLTLTPLPDVIYDDPAWVRALVSVLGSDAADIHMAGGDWARAVLKTERPDWPHHALPPLPVTDEQVRTHFLSDDREEVSALCPASVCDWLATFRRGRNFPDLQAEARYIQEYKASWQAAPYEPIFVTVDSLVTHRDRLLVVRRGGMPGRGLHALPGGFIDTGEWLLQSAIRELQEETCIAVGGKPASASDLRSWQSAPPRTFDWPLRSARGRTITHLFRFDCPADKEVSVTAADDAAGVEWLSWDETEPQTFFEDHWFMIRAALA